MKIEIEIPDELANAIFRTLGGPDDNINDICRRYTQLTNKVFAQWLLNIFRPERINEQHEQWLHEIFSEFHPHEEPSVAGVYGRFRFPRPRAEYLVRRLRQRQETTWRKNAYDELKSRLGEKSDIANHHLEANRIDTEIEFVITSGAAAEFERIFHEFLIENRRKGGLMPFPPRLIPGMGNLSKLLITADLWKNIGDWMNKDENDE